MPLLYVAATSMAPTTSSKTRRRATEKCPIILAEAIIDDKEFVSWAIQTG